VVAVPGPCAALAALASAGLPADPFLFVGFLPRSPGRLRKRLLLFRELPATLVIYESPERIAATLQATASILGDRPAAIARELTKLHEEVRTGTLTELAAHYHGRRVRGEVVLLVTGAPAAGSAEEEDARPAAAASLARQLLGDGHSPREATRRVAAQLGLPRKAAYALVLQVAAAAADEPAAPAPRAHGPAGPREETE